MPKKLDTKSVITTPHTIRIVKPKEQARPFGRSGVVRPRRKGGFLEKQLSPKKYQKTRRI